MFFKYQEGLLQVVNPFPGRLPNHTLTRGPLVLKLVV